MSVCNSIQTCKSIQTYLNDQKCLTGTSENEPERIMKLVATIILLEQEEKRPDLRKTIQKEKVKVKEVNYLYDKWSACVHNKNSLPKVYPLTIALCFGAIAYLGSGSTAGTIAASKVDDFINFVGGGALACVATYILEPRYHEYRESTAYAKYIAAQNAMYQWEPIKQWEPTDLVKNFRGYRNLIIALRHHPIDFDGLLVLGIIGQFMFSSVPGVVPQP